MPIVRVNIPYSGIWNADIYVPEDALDDLGGWINDNPDVYDNLVIDGWPNEEQLDYMSAWVDE